MKKTLFRIVAILLILVLSSSSVISSTLAKYVTHGGAFTDEARVAKWGVEIHTEVDSLFSTNYTSKDGKDVVISMNSEEKVVAPGTEKSIRIITEITGQPEVAFEINNIADIELDPDPDTQENRWVDADGNYYCPLYFTVGNETKNGMEFLSADEFEDWIENRIAKYTAQYAPGTNLENVIMDIDISWRWAFDNDEYSNDIDDTFLGNAENKATINFKFVQEVVQIQEFETVYEIVGADTILFGSYPQSDVTNEPIAETLNALLDTDKDGNIDKLPESGEYYSNGWTSYEYYSGNNKANYMWYMDVEEGGEKFRGVYFEQYRPITNISTISDNSTAEAVTIDNCNQDENRYFKKNVYWFKYDPISWTILDETIDGKTLILCDTIIDVQAYQDGSKTKGTKYYNDRYDEYYANNYEYSTIRKWLNETFYDTAFSELQKAIIIATTLDNSLTTVKLNAGNKGKPEQYVCGDTIDNVFMLSTADIINTEYGFAGSISTKDTAKQKEHSEYAKAQGLHVDSNGNATWWLRSFFARQASDVWFNSCGVRYINWNLVASNGDYTYVSEIGVLPAIWIQLAE